MINIRGNLFWRSTITRDAEQLLAVALKKVPMGSGFTPSDLGAKIGLNKLQADLAARALANAGILVLGFDNSAEFSLAYRKANAPVLRKEAKKRKKVAAGV